MPEMLPLNCKNLPIVTDARGRIGLVTAKHGLKTLVFHRGHWKSHPRWYGTAIAGTSGGS